MNTQTPIIVSALRYPPQQVILLNSETDLGAEKIRVLQQRLRQARELAVRLQEENAELRVALAAQQQMSDDLATELECVYALQGQDAEVVARYTLAAEVDDAA